MRKRRKTATFFRGVIIEGMGALLFLMLIVLTLPGWSDSQPVEPNREQVTQPTEERVQMPANSTRDTSPHLEISTAGESRPRTDVAQKIGSVTHFDREAVGHFRSVQPAFQPVSGPTPENVRHAIYHQPMGAGPALYYSSGS